jgi:hypothetical protein
MTGGETAYLAMAISAVVIFALVLGWVSLSEKRGKRH